MNLNQVTLPVNDMVKALSFYQVLGFKLVVNSAHYARFMCPHGGSTFSIVLDEAHVANGATIYFEHNKLDEWVSALKSAGICFAQEPIDMPYLWREAVLFDPSGNKIKLFWAGENRLNPPWRVGRSEAAPN